MESQKKKVKIYTDAGANISFLKSYFNDCEFFIFPYDSSHRRKKSPIFRVASPSKAQLDDAHISYNETKFKLSDFSSSPVHQQLEEIVGPDNRRDVLHLDSAQKEQVDLFLTGDKAHIWSKRHLIEKVVCFKIYYTSSEQSQILSTIESIIFKTTVQ